jgi:hypothetical protein
VQEISKYRKMRKEEDRISLNCIPTRRRLRGKERRRWKDNFDGGRLTEFHKSVDRRRIKK